MRLLHVEPAVLRKTRKALARGGEDWDRMLYPQFEPPPAPEGVPQTRWRHIAEDVVRAERVSSMVREQGLEASCARFGDSTHAVEVATVIAAAAQVGKVTFELLRSLLACPIDELVAYGEFIALLLEVDADRDRVVEVYELFHAAVMDCEAETADWRDRAAAVQDGLATLYVQVGRLDDAHDLFAERHQRASDLMPALAASRSFLAAGHVARAMHWLERGASRADEIDRPMMAFRLRKKRERLGQRLH